MPSQHPKTVKGEGSASLISDSQTKANLPAISVVCVCSTPPDVRVVFLCVSGVDVVTFLSQRAAYKLHASELVDAAGQQHAIVMQVGALLAARLSEGRRRQ